MDNLALKSVFDSYLTSNPITTVLNDSILLDTNFSIDDEGDGITIKFVAPFNPSSEVKVSNIKIISHYYLDPIDYDTVWTGVDTCTLSPSPNGVINVGDLFTIGANTYEVSNIDGDSVTFTTPVSEVSVFIANVTSPEVTYQWQISEDSGVTWVDIDGATDRYYHPVSDDVGDRIRVLVSYVDGQGTVEEPSLAPPETQPQVISLISPVYADIDLDIVKIYRKNLLSSITVNVEIA